MDRRITRVAGLMMAALLVAQLAASMGIVESQTVFRVGWGGTSLDTLNPFTTYAQISTWITLDVYSRLVRVSSNYFIIRAGSSCVVGEP